MDALRQAREDACLTQAALGGRLGRDQRYVSDIEVGVRRLDLLQVSDWARACGLDLTKFAAAVQAALDAFDAEKTALAKGNAASRRRLRRK